MNEFKLLRLASFVDGEGTSQSDSQSAASQSLCVGRSSRRTSALRATDTTESYRIRRHSIYAIKLHCSFGELVTPHGFESCLNSRELQLAKNEVGKPQEVGRGCLAVSPL